MPASVSNRVSPSKVPITSNGTPTKLKQGNLFSFFSKKPSPGIKKNTGIKSSLLQPPSKGEETTAKSPDAESKSFNRPLKEEEEITTKRRTTKQQHVISQIKVGMRLSVFWPDDEEYYPAKVTSIKRSKGSANITTLLYDDGEVETLDLAGEKFKLLDDEEIDDDRKVGSANTCNARDSSSSTPTITSDSKRSNSNKKRRILEESEDEFEVDKDLSDDGDSDASEFIAPEDNEDDEEDNEEMSMVITDEDDEDLDQDNKKGKEKISGKKRLLVTRVKNPYEKKNKKAAISMEEASVTSPPDLKIQGSENDVASNASKEWSKSEVASLITPPPKPRPTAKKNSTQSFSSFANNGQCNPNNKVQSKSDTSPNRRVLPHPNVTPPSANTSKTNSKTVTSTKIPLPDTKAVNQAGTHYHNHFTFLKPPNRRDIQNRPTSHPDYDPRTLRVDYNEMERVTKSKLTPASRQWWEIKSQYADTLLLFKTGKFYEIFHNDADVAVQVLGFSYMKGANAHAGFPEIGYGNFCGKLVSAGYKVARVEQTETPDMLKERKKKTKTGKKPQVVNREVCSIMSAGTRTFCFMDDVKCLEDGGENVSGLMPLLAIKEKKVGIKEGSDRREGEDQADCEYGIAIVDAVRGLVTLGQFADDVLKSRMNTLLTTFRPSEILVQGGTDGVSPTLLSLLNSVKNTSLHSLRIEKVHSKESFPKSTAVEAEIRSKMERPKSIVQPWDVEETIAELHRRAYYPRSSRKNAPGLNAGVESGISRWPEVLKACIKGGADLALSAFGATLFYLQRSLIDEEILSMGIVKAYCPPEPANSRSQGNDDNSRNLAGEELRRISAEEERLEDGIDLTENCTERCQKGLPGSKIERPDSSSALNFTSHEHNIAVEDSIDHMSLDGTTLANLEILSNSHSNTVAGSLWSKINHTKSPHGSRLLRAWLLRPLFRKIDIDRRADAVEELIGGGAAVAMSEARDMLSKCGDMERLLSRVHSMSGVVNTTDGGFHPNERAVLYETAIHTKRKVGDFSKLLYGLRAAAQIPDLFSEVDITSGLLSKIVRLKEDGGCFPSNLNQELDWFFDNFDCNLASKGLFEPTRGIDEDYDAACDIVEQIKQDLEDYKDDVCANLLKPSHSARSSWKYVNTKNDSKDKYLIELPVSVKVPCNFYVKGKRGSGAKQINKYRTPVVEELVQRLEKALDVVKIGKARGMKLVFARFDSMRSLWASAAQATSMLDALGSLAETSSSAGFSRPTILDCPPSGSPSIDILQGRHPCVDFTHSGGDFIPNNLSLGGNQPHSSNPRVLLLSGPNMGGKSTLLRQTCLLSILAQIGCFVPAEECTITPIDRIFTRLGASDRILLGQSTFFVELAETAAALRGATRRSLVIMDELGRGTSTFDGTAIASATVKHLVERNKCLAMFATHYHSLLEDWKDKPSICLGHMECIVEGDADLEDKSLYPNGMENPEHNITFLYTLGTGSCPKSFGINVARLAALPKEVLSKAKRVSSSFEAEMNASSENSKNKFSVPSPTSLKLKIESAIKKENWDELGKLWEELQTS